VASGNSTPTLFRQLASLPLISMTQAPESGAINRLHFSGAGFWYVCHIWHRIRLVPDSGAD